MKRLPVTLTRTLEAGLSRPEEYGLPRGRSRSQTIVLLAEEALERRAAHLRTEARRARYAAWAADAEYQRAVREDAAIAFSEKAI